MKKAIFYHAGCPVCVSAEQQVVEAIDKQQYQVKVIHLAEQADQIVAAEAAGVHSVPALLIDEAVFHINYGASIEEVKGAVS